MLILTSKDNQNVKNAVKLKSSSKHRRKSSMFIAEGVRICVDAMLSKAEIVTFFVTEAAMAKHHEEYTALSNYAENTFVVSPSIFSYISDTETPQGFLCVIKTLDKISQFDTIKGNKRFIALECMQDPNNLGTVLRTAEALGIDGVVITSDSCDIYNPKVVRGSMGAVFRIPFLIYPTISQFLEDYNQLTSYACVVDESAEKITQVDFNAPCVAVIGNEGNGLRQNTVDVCDKSITIPMKGRAESLNASTATSIIIWEMIK